jgi:hypothetical protein
MHRTIAFPIAIAALMASVLPAAAGAVAVQLDHVRTVSFDKPVSKVFIGNPSIADITVVDSRHVVVLGKQFGRTNLVALDRTGRQVANDPMTVYGRSANVVTLNRGARQYTFSCTTHRCEAAPIPGDDLKSFYQMVSNENHDRQSMGAKAAAQDNGH